ncbi:hypothetical protein [Lysobacter auxotrophicus]|uniref:XRE family transcriptional regulator n=1 Tax=Lysobacter auxotrophicus TaxID=2992573 RepID=A0ABN6UL90_9GAMM|nr:hypothetical protein [Lysobacter auxotrophicus]BDU16947.1 hypothetical protein LA521A_21480 [Lysobacter auxotrophicus]
MATVERRTPTTGIRVQRRMGLTIAQRTMLQACERCGWRLAFVRTPLEHPLPVLFATAHDFVAVREDGSIDRWPDIALRH